MQNRESPHDDRLPADEPSEMRDGPEVDGPLVPMPQSPRGVLRELLSGFLIVNTVGGLTLFLLSQTTGRCAGATRSSKASWQIRQQQIDQALEQATSEQQAESPE